MKRKKIIQRRVESFVSPPFSAQRVSTDFDLSIELPDSSARTNNAKADSTRASMERKEPSELRFDMRSERNGRGGREEEGQEEKER